MDFPSFSQPSVMKHDFSKVPHADINRSSFRRSHGYKSTFDEGDLIPIFFDEALPGDTFSVRLSSIIRMDPLLKPIMDNMYVDYFFFAVPNRLLWENWQRFMGERDPDPDSSIDYVVPQIQMGANPVVALSLGDYFGLPTAVNNLEFNSLHFRAYNLIWNEWFRDENLQDSVVVDKDDGPDAIADYVLLKRGKRHDYFTSCLPWPQKGDAVDLPLGSSAPVIGDGQALGLDDGTGFFAMRGTTGTSDIRREDAGYGTAVGSAAAGFNNGLNVRYGVTDDPDNSGLFADLSAATAATINSLREAFQLQRLMERDARGGTRYTEIINSHFGVTSPDARLQRPEYLGGGSRPIIVDPVPATSTFGGEPIGRLAATVYSNQSGIGFSKSFTEHCTLIGLINVRADLTYQTGMNRMWSRQTKYDFYWPALAHLGEQEVLNKEIYAQGLAADDDVFGYQERWAEYRYKPSLITGQFRSNHATSLDAWHLSEDFGALPVLNTSFIEDDAPVERVVAIPSYPHFFFDAFFDINCTRPMPLYSVPGLIDHF